MFAILGTKSGREFVYSCKEEREEKRWGKKGEVERGGRKKKLIEFRQLINFVCLHPIFGFII